MNRIALFTINDYKNYGNRLQNYAAQEYLKSLGYEVETVVNNTKYSADAKKPNLLSRVNNIKTHSISSIINKISNKLFKKNNKIMWLKIKSFIEFTNEYIAETDFTITDINIPSNLLERYDYFVTGSDQVWNPNNHRTSCIDFLTFSENNKRIALSPSFGVSKINQKYIDKYKEWLNGFTYLSVREEAGANIIKELTGQEVPVLIDPTLLLNKEEWLKIAKEAPFKPQKRYLLTYFLGGVPKKYQNQISEMSKVYQLEVVNLGDTKDKKNYIIGPDEFLDYINSCTLFCTDSFHGAVFSIIFKKPFVVYKREGASESMYSRIETLLDKFNLQSRKAEMMIEENLSVLEIKYDHISVMIENERRKVEKFLIESFDDKGIE